MHKYLDISQQNLRFSVPLFDRTWEIKVIYTKREQDNRCILTMGSIGSSVKLEDDGDVCQRGYRGRVVMIYLQIQFSVPME